MSKIDRHFRLNKLVVKPTLRCTANCGGCARRTSLHRSAIQGRSMTFQQWRQVVSEAQSLGCSIVAISGGEPTLYSQLIDLVSYASRKGMCVRMNSNGSPVTIEFAEQLIKAGLSGINVSLYSHLPEVQSKIRRSKRLWENACNTVRMYADLKKQYPDFNLSTQTIMLKENFETFDELLRFHYSLGSDQMRVSYLENDFEGKNLMTVGDIHRFRGAVLPKLREFCLSLDVTVREKALERIDRLFHEGFASPEDFARGQYWKKEPCRVPQKFALVIANGDVHPCNIVEYLHEPVMGNIFENTLVEIWQSGKWDRFRRDLLPECALCPINLHTIIPLRPAALSKYERIWQRFPAVGRHSLGAIRTLIGKMI